MSTAITLHPHGGAVLSAPDEAEPDRYIVRPAVPISKVHQRTVVLRDKDGNPRLDADGKPIRRTARFDEEALRAMAEDANARARLGNLCSIHFGHTIDGEKDEQKQPPPVGFLRNFRVGPVYNESGELVDATPHLVADHVYDKRYADEARTYPHRSTEVHTDFANPERSQLQGLALLRQPPELEMGLLTYARDPDGGDLTFGPTIDESQPMPPVGGEPQPSTGEETAMEMDERQIDELCDKLCERLTPMIAEKIGPHLAQHIEDAIANVGDEGDVNNSDYDGDEQSDVDNAAGIPGDMSTYLPGMVDGENPRRRRHNRDGRPEEYTSDGEGNEERVRNCKGDDMNHDSPAIASLTDRLRAMERENATLRGALEAQQDDLGTLMVRNARADLGHKLDALRVEGVEFDPNEEIVTLLKLEPDDQDAYINRMKVRYRKTPVGANDVDVASPSRPKVPGSMSKGDMNKIVSYATKNGLSFADAKAQMATKSLI